MGAIYVEIDASVVNNGIMTMATSGGEVGDSYWILWDQSGFISNGWYWTDPNVPLGDNWKNNPYGTYSGDEEGFKKYLEQENPENLNTWLGESWTSAMKWAFLQSYDAVFKNCTSPA